MSRNTGVLISSKSTQMQSLTISSFIFLSVLRKHGGDAKSYSTESPAEVASIPLSCVCPGARRIRGHEEGQLPDCDKRHLEPIEQCSAGIDQIVVLLLLPKLTVSLLDIGR